jgi:hypothetical protein
MRQGREGDHAPSFIGEVNNGRHFLPIAHAFSLLGI